MDRLSSKDYTSTTGPVEANKANADAALSGQRGGREERHTGPDPQLLPQYPPPHRRPSPVLLPRLQNNTFKTQALSE
ncbi:hypothetical protein V492_06286 [Pseudogymnoascus sp. VKM F-4246]|nr:hypothetical protein V492_06286 [Pseudogymnoascus sp. VKM F-4246]